MIVGVVGAAGLGALVVSGNRSNLGTSILLFVISILLVEGVRRARAPELPWALPQASVLAWGALVLVPWALRVLRGTWPVGTDGYVGLTLNDSWAVNALALAGLTVGTMFGMRRTHRALPSQGPQIVRWGYVTAAFAGVVATYLLSFLLAGRPLAALWRLNGSIAYASDADTYVRLGALDLAPTVGVMVVLVACAVRREYARLPNRWEIFLLTCALLLSLGSANRYRVYLLVLGWMLIQLRVGRRSDRAMSGRLLRGFLAIVGSAGLMFATLGYISVARSGENPASVNLTERSISGIDVIGAEELLLDQGARLGELHGRSYTEIPSQLVPRRLAVGKQLPAAQTVVDSYLDPRVGYSTPFWFEGALNYGLAGAFCTSALFALALVRLQVRARESRRRLAQAIVALGPVVTLISYQLLSRLLLLQLVTTAASIAVGAWLAMYAVRRTRVDSAATPSPGDPGPRLPAGPLPQVAQAGRPYVSA